MSSWDDMVINNWRDLGLEEVVSIDWSDGYYQFDMTLAYYQPSTGKFFWADDSGCSCPSPFEGFTKLEDFETGTAWQLRNHLFDRYKDQIDYFTGEPRENHVKGEYMSALEKLQRY